MGLGALRLAIQPLVNSAVTTRQKLFSPKLLLLTNTALTASLSVTGDIFQQFYQANTKQKNVTWDSTRTKFMACTGLIIGPFIHYWYILLDRWLPGRALRVLCKKVLLDQLVCSPVYVSLFMLSLGLMEKKSLAEMKKDFVDKGSVLYVAEWVVWPPAQFVNFYFLPTKYRVLYDNTISLAFDCFWSYVWYEMDTDETGTRTGSIRHESKEDPVAKANRGEESKSMETKHLTSA